MTNETLHYRCPADGQTATLVVYHVPGMRDHVAATYLNDVPTPLWEERVENDQSAAINVRCWRDIMARRLTRERHMVRVEDPPRAA